MRAGTLALAALAGVSAGGRSGDVEACSCIAPNIASQRSPLVSDVPVPSDAQPWFLAESCSSAPPCGLLTEDAGARVPLPGQVECVLILARIIPDEPLTPGAEYGSNCDPYVDRGDYGFQGRADTLTVRGDALPSLPPLTLLRASARVERIDSCCSPAKLVLDAEFAEDDATVSRFFDESGLIEVEYESSGERFVIPAAPDEPEFWRRDRSTAPEVDDITLTPVSANAVRGDPLTIPGHSIAVDPIYIPCSIGEERSPLLLLVVFALAWRRRTSRSQA